MSTANQTPLEALLDQVDAMAPFPAVASRVMQITEDERFSAYDLAAIIATDTALTAKILRLANSAYYAYPRKIGTVRDAVVLIGFRAVRSTAIASAIVDIFPTSEPERPFNVDPFWGHSVACGIIAETMARETHQAPPDEAFTAGILHDLGRLVLHQYAAEPFDAAIQRALGDDVSLDDMEREAFGFDHSELGARLAERWAFPETLCDAIREHEQVPIEPNGSGLTYVVGHANHLCNRFGLWCGLDSVEGQTAHPGDGLPGPAPKPLYDAVMERIGGLDRVQVRVMAFMNSAAPRQLRWYSHAGGAAAAPTPQPVG